MAMAYGISKVCHRGESQLILINKYLGAFLVNYTKFSHLHKV